MNKCKKCGFESHRTKDHEYVKSRRDMVRITILLCVLFISVLLETPGLFAGTLLIIFGWRLKLGI